MERRGGVRVSERLRYDNLEMICEAQTTKDVVQAIGNDWDGLSQVPPLGNLETIPKNLLCLPLGVSR